jgi:hypothetical protein
MVRSSEELLDMAAECRALALVAKSRLIKEQLLEIAEQFERLAAYTSEGPRTPGRKILC